MPTWLVILITALLTYAASVVARWFMPREKKIEHRIKPLYGVADESFTRTLGSLLPPTLLDGNRITPLYNGDQIFPAMLDAIASAEKTITFETFIYWSGSIGLRFAEALVARAKAGVRTHVLLDWIGTKKMKEEYLHLMENAGVQVERYHKPRPLTFALLNQRTHRKILVVDGKIGFTGGVGIADEWTGHAQDPDHWRDTHFRIDGPAVAQLQSAFTDNWTKTHSDVLHGDDYFPELEPAGQSRVQIFKSSPGGGSESVRLMYLLAIACAQKTIRISTAYFVPDELSIDFLVEAKQRGVEIDIIVPGEHIDADVVRRASRARWGRLLKAGVRIGEYQPTMYHVKLLVVDDLLVSIGSANFDNRSFGLNDEVNINTLDQEVAAEQVARFNDDLTHTRQITYEQWRKRPLREKIIERAASLIGSQL